VLLVVAVVAVAAAVGLCLHCRHLMHHYKENNIQLFEGMMYTTDLAQHKQTCFCIVGTLVEPFALVVFLLAWCSDPHCCRCDCEVVVAAALEKWLFHVDFSVSVHSALHCQGHSIEDMFDGLL
jgi:hypothetical protein